MVGVIRLVGQVSLPVLCLSICIVCRAADSGISIVLPGEVDLVVRTAADELRAYLSKASGMPVAIAEERAPTKAVDTIYLGNTAFAAAHGIDFKAFADEEWMCRSIDGALVIGGGGRRGALYGVYHFLEDELGVHWFSPSVEVVPVRCDLKLAGVDRRGRRRGDRPLKALANWHVLC